MRKKYLSILVILITIIAVYFMLFSNSTLYEDDYMMVQKSKEILFDKIKDEEEKYNKNASKDIIDYKNNDIDIYEEEKLPKKEGILENETISKKESVYEEEHNINKEENNSINEVVIEDNKKPNNEIFKVDKTTILERLTTEEKKELGKIIKRLSISDYITIVSSIKNNGELECCLKILNILNRRLGEKDYEVARTIFEPYVNVDLLEDKLANN